MVSGSSPMIKKLTVILTFIAAFVGHAQDESLFRSASRDYNDGNYEEAVKNYLAILEEGQHSAALYYNLGNAYYKLNEIGPSIYFYEKALLLAPNDQEIRNNLRFAQHMTLDAIDKLPETGLSKIYNTVKEWLSFDEWAYIAVAFMILFVLTYITFHSLRYTAQKRIAFITSLMALLFAIGSVAMAFTLYTDFNMEDPAIIFSEQIAVRSEPNPRGQEVFVLHEGTKVEVLDELNDYLKIRLADGKTGWLPSADIRRLKDF